MLYMFCNYKARRIFSIFVLRKSNKIVHVKSENNRFRTNKLTIKHQPYPKSTKMTYSNKNMQLSQLYSLLIFSLPFPYTPCSRWHGCFGPCPSHGSPLHPRGLAHGGPLLGGVFLQHRAISFPHPGPHFQSCPGDGYRCRSLRHNQKNHLRKRQ